MSSPSIKLPSGQQAARTKKQLESNGQYYQMVYDDGRRRYIVESRRRSKVFHNTETVILERLSLSPIKPITMENSSKVSSPSGSLSYPWKSSSRRSCLASRDGGDQPVSSKTKSAPIIVTTPTATASKMQRVPEVPQRWTEPTPPPTPRLTRLPTPELSELDEAPFCECDAMANFVKFCTCCKKEAGPHYD